ncbi:MAG: hypothetical protein PHO12_05975 [Bacteroidales bacterium]|nr:hypothetical protein [Bacteroidales bacterium]MDD4684892.1 hypothetical protein [Bacteroidales bacterium]
MNTEKWIAKKIVIIFNPLFTSVYAFIYYLLLMVLFSNGYRDALSIVLKSITLYTLVSCLFPIFVIYLLNDSSFHNIEENLKNSNTSYVIVCVSYLVSYMYFSMLNISVWFNMGLLIPVYASLISLVLRKKTTIIYEIVIIGAITFYVFLLTIQFYYIFSIFPLLIAIFCSGLLLYSYLIQNLYTANETLHNYLIGCLLTILIMFFVLII